MPPVAPHVPRPAPAASPSATARAMPWRVAAWLTPVELAVLGAIWGASFLFMRIAARPFGAFALVDVRLFLGAAVLLPFLWRARARFPLRAWPRLALIGMVMSGAPFVLFAWGAERAPAGIGAICNALTVLCAALVGALFFGEAIGPRRIVALLVGFGGVVVLAAGNTAGGGVGLAVAAGSTAALLYGFGINLIRRHLSALPPAAASCATLGSAAILLLPFALATWPAHPVPATAWLAAALLGVLCTGLAFVLYYRLIARIGAGRAATVTYLVPPFGVAWAWLLLDEPLTPSMAVAVALILGAVAFSQRAR